MAKLGAQNLLDQEVSMGGEDFSEYPRMLKIPGLMFSLGAVDPLKMQKGEALPGLHSDRFAPDAEPAIEVGSQLVQACLLEALK